MCERHRSGEPNEQIGSPLDCPGAPLLLPLVSRDSQVVTTMITLLFVLGPSRFFPGVFGVSHGGRDRAWGSWPAHHIIGVLLPLQMISLCIALAGSGDHDAGGICVKGLPNQGAERSMAVLVFTAWSELSLAVLGCPGLF